MAAVLGDSTDGRDAAPDREKIYGCMLCSWLGALLRAGGFRLHLQADGQALAPWYELVRP